MYGNIICLGLVLALSVGYKIKFELCSPTIFSIGSFSTFNCLDKDDLTRYSTLTFNKTQKRVKIARKCL